MGRCDKLLEKARRNPEGLAFTDATALAGCFGFIHVRTTGSHHIFKRPDHMDLLNLQPRRGWARAYQVRQLLAEIEGILSKEPRHESR